jgi:hypothetical protein
LRTTHGTLAEVRHIPPDFSEFWTSGRGKYLCLQSSDLKNLV